MASGTILNNYRGYTLKTEWNSVPQLLENKSIVTVQHKLVQALGYDLDIGARTNSCTVDKDTQSYVSGAICNGGNTTVDLGTTVHEVQHDADGSKSCTITDTFYLKANITNVYVEKITVTDTIVLDKIPRQALITSAMGFNDEGVPNVTFNKAGSNYPLKIKLVVDEEELITRNNIENSGKYSFELSETERDLLRNKCTNSNELAVTYKLETTINNQRYSSIADAKMNIINANPATHGLDYIDTNDNTYAVTQDVKKIIRNASYLTAKFYAATANKGATISKYELTFNGVTKTVYNANDVNFGTVDVAQDSKLYLKAIDSRGNSTTISCNVSILDYELPDAQVSVARVNNYEDTTKVKVNANYSNLDGQNELRIALQYRKHSDSVPLNSGWNDKNLAVGDDLSGKILKFSFPTTSSDFLSENGSETIVQCEKGSIIYYKTSASGVAEYVAVEYMNVETKVYEQYAWSQITNLSSYQLPDSFGKITAISSTFGAIDCIKFVDATMLENGVEAEVTCDKQYKWDFHIEVSDKIGVKHYYASLDIGKPITFWDTVKRSFAVGGFPTEESCFEVFTDFKTTGQIYMGGNKVLGFHITDSF